MIENLEQLRALYPPAKGRAVLKQISHLDAHCRHFISLSPFVVLASRGAGEDALLDSSPRGGDPGFVRVRDDSTLLIPDSPGNNRLDTIENILATGRLSLLFLIPGIDETLRVNGTARLNNDPALLNQFANEKRTPKLVIEVTVLEAYLHCAKALMRSRLWDASRHRSRSVLPTTAEIINDQTGGGLPLESQEEMARRYQVDL